MPQLDSFTYNLILELSLFHLYSLPFIFSPLENFILFFVIENTLSNFYFFSFSFDFLSNCFFGSSECQSVETYVELAEGGKSEFVKKIGNAMIQMRNLELSRIGINKCVVLRILKIKKGTS